jgi:hypothetical protein
MLLVAVMVLVVEKAPLEVIAAQVKAAENVAAPAFVKVSQGAIVVVPALYPPIVNPLRVPPALPFSGPISKLAEALPFTLMVS